MLAMTRMIPQATASMKGGKWDKNKFSGTELCGKTLGVVGLGNIGRIAADRARGLRMQVLGFDPFFDAASRQEAGGGAAALAEVVPAPTSSRCHTPLTKRPAASSAPRRWPR